MGLTDDDVREILRIIDESELDELMIETEGFSLHVLKRSAGEHASSPTLQPPRGLREDAPSPAEATEHAGSSARGPAGTSAPDAAAPPPEDGLVTIPSPMLGTFYRAEFPGAPPFVELGARLEPDTTVCIIEVMKMMNSVPAGVTGVVAEIIPENAQLVEFGQPLFRVTSEE
jgi:acetyl-CoA carboxylase biotin carboxyl carrier protein